MKNLLKAIAGFQTEVPIIYKDTQAYGYKYADLPAIIEVINPLLIKHGIGYHQTMDFHPETNSNLIITTVFHIESGESITSKMRIKENVELKGQNDFQTLGSAITYYRRYQLSAALGLVTDKDNDAQGEQKPKQTPPKTIEQSGIMEAVTEMNNCKTIEELQKCWSKHKVHQTHEVFIKAKDNLKTKLNGSN